MRKQFRDTILDLAKSDDKIILLFGDVSVYLFNDFKIKYPDRFYNLGICENTIISAAAGLSAQGFHPFVHTLSPFISERCFEQIKLDMCYNRFGGNIVSCGASFDYAWDGVTHHSYTDMGILRMLPEMEVIQPGSRKELDILLRSQYKNGKVKYFRLSDHPHNIDLPVEFAKAAVLKDSSKKVTVMTAGPLLGNVMEACSDLNVNLVYFNTIKPVDKEAIVRFRGTKILVIHDAFGLYEAICEISGLSVSYQGLPDKFLCTYGTVPQIRKEIRLDPASIRQTVIKALENEE